jgi:hypothetical protein
MLRARTKERQIHPPAGTHGPSKRRSDNPSTSVQDDGQDS